MSMAGYYGHCNFQWKPANESLATRCTQNVTLASQFSIVYSAEKFEIENFRRDFIVSIKSSTCFL